ncbi:MAG: hypothetical protein J7494_03765 [Sphingobium sp.]|nr:hypothetical protein [Sphingobium sp.]
MTHHLIRTLPLALIAAVALAGCKKEPESMNVGTVDPQAAELAKATPVVAPPPMIKTSHSYRCKDNSLIFVDFMTDDKTATYKTSKEGTVTTLKAAEAGQPYKSEDGSKTITGGGDNITYNGTACKAG